MFIAEVDNRSYWVGGNDRVFNGAWRYESGLEVPRGTPFWAVGEKYGEIVQVRY